MRFFCFYPCFDFSLSTADSTSKIIPITYVYQYKKLHITRYSQNDVLPLSSRQLTRQKPKANKNGTSPNSSSPLPAHFLPFIQLTPISTRLARRPKWRAVVYTAYRVVVSTG